MEFNGPIDFFAPSGQVVAGQGDLILAPSNEVIVSGVGLRPLFDCTQELGDDARRWANLFACSGNFLDRITINGSGVLLQGEATTASVTSIEGLDGVVDLDSPDGTVLINVNGQAIELTILPDTGQTSIEGLSGTIDLDSPDESVNINVNGQAIELTAPSGYAPSGASFILADYNDNDHLVDARKLSATSGIVLDDQGARSGSGIVLKLDFDNEPSVGEVLSWDGSKLEWATNAGGGGGTDAGQTSVEGISGVIDLDSPDESININVNGQTIEFTTPASGHAPSGASYLLVDYNDNNHLVDARILSATSGIILDEQGARSVSGIAIKLDFDNEPTLNQILSWNGQKLEWVDDQTGGAGGVSSAEKVFSPTSGTLFVLEHGLNTTAFTWSMWQTHADEQDLDPILSMIPKTVSPSGNNHAIIQLNIAVSGVTTFTG